MPTAFKKRWNGTASGDLAVSANWDAISVRDSAWNWTASGSGTNEFYLRTAANANPGFGAAPGTVQLNNVDVMSGTLGSLAAGRYGYGDNDSLGYSTIYVRLADGANPNSKTFGFVSFRQTPLAGDLVRVPAGSGAMSINLDLSAIAIAEFVVDDGHLAAIGSTTSPLRISPTTRFEYAGGVASYINLASSTIDALVTKTAQAGQGGVGLYLSGGNLGKLNVIGGSVGVAVRHGEASTIAEVRCVGTSAKVTIGEGAAVTTVYQSDGAVVLQASVTTYTLEGGDLLTTEAGTIGTLSLQANDRPKRAAAVLNSSGTVTTVNLKNSLGSIDWLQTAVARTVTTLNWEAGELYFDPNTLTISTFNRPTGGPMQLTATAA